jgi:hypothetical protein
MVETFSIVHKKNHSHVVMDGTADELVEWLKLQPDVSGYEVLTSENRYCFPVRKFLNQHTIPKNLVPKYYTMDQKTEDLVPNGKHLANGMKVLIANPDFRERPEELGNESRRTPSDWLKDKILMRNRWCTVTHVEIASHTNTVQFVGVYDDGTKRQWVMGVGHAWLVKKDSIPDPVLAEEKEAERYNSIYRIVEDALDALDQHTCSSCYGPGPDLGQLAEETAKKILGTLG